MNQNIESIIKQKLEYDHLISLIDPMIQILENEIQVYNDQIEQLNLQNRILYGRYNGGITSSDLMNFTDKLSDIDRIEEERDKFTDILDMYKINKIKHSEAQTSIENLIIHYFKLESGNRDMIISN